MDGELVGGLILPHEQWHLGHPDGESVGGAEHVACNTGAPSRLRASADAAVAELKHGTAAIVWGSEPPAFSIGYEKPLGPGESGFTVLFDNAPVPEDVSPEHPGVSIVCLHCLIEEHPEIGRGLDIAHEYGVADLDENGEWVVDDLSRLDKGE